MFDLKCSKCDEVMEGIKVGDGIHEPARTECFDCEYQAHWKAEHLLIRKGGEYANNID